MYSPPSIIPTLCQNAEKYVDDNRRRTQVYGKKEGHRYNLGRAFCGDYFAAALSLAVWIGYRVLAAFSLACP